MVCKLYRRLCRKWGPRGLTLSGYAFVRARETGNTFWRDRLDGFFLLFLGHRQHCQASFQRSKRIHPRTGS
jgi:hypothetical protein